MKKGKVVLVSDYGGCDLKNEIKNYVSNLGYEIVDLGLEDSLKFILYVE